MALRPVSPVQLVTQALRSVPPAFQTSVWHADRDRFTGATFGTLCAVAFATGTDYAELTGTSVPYLRTRQKPRHAIGSSSDSTILGTPIIGPPIVTSTSVYHTSQRSQVWRHCWGRCAMSHTAINTGSRLLTACLAFFTPRQIKSTFRQHRWTRKDFWSCLATEIAVRSRRQSPPLQVVVTALEKSRLLQGSSLNVPGRLRAKQKFPAPKIATAG